MSSADLVAQRLGAQHLWPAQRAPLDVARALLAMQGQDAFSAAWSLGVRTGATEAEIAAAFERGELVRSWPVRGTLHVHAAEDVPWLSALLGPRLVETTARRRAQLGLDDRALARAEDVVLRALEAGPRARGELMDALTAAGVDVREQRGYHHLFHLGIRGRIACGPSRDGEASFVSVLRAIPRARTRDRDEALGELARRYFEGHGPAPLGELALWAKLTAADARRALDVARPHLSVREIDGVAHGAGVDTWPMHVPALWLPGFDEYLLGYRERSAVLAPRDAPKIVPGGNGIFQPTLVCDGRVVGTWRRKRGRAGVELAAELFRPVSRLQRAALEAAAGPLRRFLGTPVSLRWT